MRRVSLMRRTLLIFVALVSFPSAAWTQGNPVGPEFRVNTYTTFNQRYPSVAVDSMSNFVVVWSSRYQDGSFTGVFGQRYSSSGAPLGPEFRVNTYTTGGQVDPAVTADSSGNFIVVWEGPGQGDTGIGIFGQRYANSGVPLGPEFRVNTYTTNVQIAAAVASDSAGNFVVVWEGFGPEGPSGGVFAQRYASTGVPLGGQFRVNTYTTGGGVQAAVASDVTGNFVVVWASDAQDGQSWGIFGQRFASTGAPLGPEFQVNTFTTSSQLDPSIASDSSGSFVVVWESPQDGSITGISGQRYVNSGAPLGPEFRVNTYTNHYQDDPFVASNSAGNFVVVWASYTQDGSGDGVFGQRYRPIVPVELMRFGVE